MISNTTLKKEHYCFLLFTVVVCFVALLPRLGSGFLPETYLWAEDGPIFITQANLMGIHSLWTSYNGYLLLYPRLVSYAASFFDLAYQPAILGVGWAVAFTFMVAITQTAARKYGLSHLFSALVCLLIVLQPNYGEVFFNITNSQWLLGLALTVRILCINDFDAKPTLLDYIGLTILSFTGVYSLILIPIILIRGYATKSLFRYPYLHLIVFLGAATQFHGVVTSGRLSAPADSNVDAWISGIRSLLMFGANRPLTYLAALLFWTAFVWALIRSFNSSRKKGEALDAQFWLLLTALVFIAIEIYVMRGNPAVAFPAGGGSRYNWIPNALLFLAAFIASKRLPYARLLILVSLTVVCLINFHRFKPLEYSFQHYVKLSRYKPTSIPINPQSAGSGFNISADPSFKGTKPPSDVQEIHLNLGQFASSGLRVDGFLPLSATSTSDDPIFAFDDSFNCGSASSIAVEAEIKRSEAGFIQLFWSDLKHGATEERSQKRGYPAGLIRATFAFPNFGADTYLRIDPLEQPGAVEISAVTIYCLS